MISFISALYNEEHEVADLILHIYHQVDGVYLVDDFSQDRTFDIISGFISMKNNIFVKMMPEHTGLPETVKNEALKMVPDGSWILMLDADERFITPISTIVEWIKSPVSETVDYVYFDQYEIIDGIHVRTFQKSKLFRKESITFSSGIHEDDKFTGNGEYYKWEVAHRKTSDKQRQREREYLETYQRLLDEGKIDEGRHQWLKGLHHYEKG